MRNNKSNKGFTLIELLIVIAIIGILAAVLIPNLLNARASANDTAASSVARNVSTAVGAVSIQNNVGLNDVTCTLADGVVAVTNGSNTQNVNAPAPVTGVDCTGSTANLISAVIGYRGGTSANADATAPGSGTHSVTVEASF